ncbi:MAG: NUDIX hydrolase [Patescibacteria group bacterium]
MDENHLQFGGNPPASSEQRVGVYVVIYNDQGNILVCEVDNELHLLGGRVEEGEDHIEAMNREAMEEAGARIDNIELGSLRVY